MEPNEEISQALDEARQRRKTLHDAIVYLEKSISSPAAGRIPDWTASVLKEMTEVRDAFGQHVMVTEKPDGLYDEILERAPRLETNVRRLREETWPLEEARDDLQRFMGSVIRHRQRGADLVWEAYNVDIGGIE